MENSLQKQLKTMVAPRFHIDRLSQLTDDILHYILSFMDIVDVVRLSLLSRRWKSLWITIPYLNFDYDHFKSQKIRLIRSEHLAVAPVQENFHDLNFQELVNWVLMSRGSNKITRLRLDCGEMYCDMKITRWFHVAVRRHLQELELEVDTIACLETFELPDCLITCESLKVLRLKLPWCFFELPSYLKFKQLTSLHLELVQLTDDDLIRKLFAECSVLETLSLIDCVGTSIEVLDISSSSLKCLTVTSYYPRHHDIFGFFNCEFRISCPKLISFTYMGGVAKNYCLENISSLDYMCIDIFPEDKEWSDEKVGHLACTILKQVENISVMKLHVQAMWYLSHAIEELQCISTAFCRLKSLHLSIEVSERYTQVLFHLLKRCPNLKSLTLFCDKIKINKKPDEFRNSPERQLRFVKFALKNGFVLEKLIIIWSKKFEKKKISTVQKLLHLLHILELKSFSPLTR